MTVGAEEGAIVEVAETLNIMQAHNRATAAIMEKKPFMLFYLRGQDQQFFVNSPVKFSMFL